jgi:branched-chain amino acid transport system permease protein
MGIDVAGHKMLAFVLGAAPSPAWRARSTRTYTFVIGPANTAFENAVEILTMAVFGGTANLVGPVVGGAHADRAAGSAARPEGLTGWPSTA